jgi:hypothetical protein
MSIFYNSYNIVFAFRRNNAKRDYLIDTRIGAERYSGKNIRKSIAANQRR